MCKQVSSSEYLTPIQLTNQQTNWMKLQMHHFCDLGCRKCFPSAIWHVERGCEVKMFFRGLDEGDLDEGDEDDHDQGDDQGDDDDDDDDESDNNDNDDGDDDKQ